MDDFMKDIFSNDENEKVNADAPIFDNTQAPVIKEETEIAPEPPVVNEKPAEVQSEPKTAPEINSPINEFKPMQPANEPTQSAHVNPQPQNAYGFTQNEEPKKNVFFQPPIQQPVQPPVQRPVQPPVQPPVANAYNNPNNNFEVPQAFNQAPRAQRADQFDVKPKKKSKAGLTIFIIGILVLAIAISGLAYAVKNYDPDNSSDSGISSSQSADEKKEKSNNSDGSEVTVNSSEKAAKKDSKGNLTVAGVVEQSKSSCVGITVYSKQDDLSYFYNFGSDGNTSSNNEVKSGEGSGVIMSESNGTTYIMTCAHVISDGTKFTVTLDNDKEYDAQLVGSDGQTDIGVLSIKATGLNVAEFGDSKDIEVGEDCVAIGCPGGLVFKNSVTKGIVSAVDVPVDSSIGYKNECIQVDAAINPGNSGGALFNMQGQVIGINSSKIASTEYEGMGFAVPSNTAISTANSLIKNGYVKGRARLGIQYATFSMLQSGGIQILSALEKKGFNNAEGTMIIQEIESGSDLNGKVEKNDMIVAVNGKTMTSTDIMTSVLSKCEPGDTVELTIARIDGNDIKTFKVKCKLIESKE